tara:strand:- start:5978 stop:6721 length:744 start_codon:yes stop_codon:yes gene_type:complete
MIGQVVMSFSPLHEGILIKRYKRFLADIRLKDGTLVTAHCPNTGPMRGLLSSDSKVRLKYSPSPLRKLSWTLEQIQVVNNLNDLVWVGVNTSFANTLIRKTIEKQLLKDKLGKIKEIRSEIKYGKEGKSRVDFVLKPYESNKDSRDIYLEVKNVTWVEGDSCLFPDTVTLRGQKHIKELINIMPNSRGVLLFCITRNDMKNFISGDQADPDYGKLLKLGIRNGLEVIPCSYQFNKDHVSWMGLKPLG